MGSFDRLLASTRAVSRRVLSRRSLAGLSLVFMACEFQTYQGVVGANQYSGSGIGVLAVSYDGTSVWMRSGSSLKVFDSTTGAQNASRSQTGVSFIRAVAPAVESGYRDGAWTLHKNGARTRWNPDLNGSSATRAAIPTTGATAADSRKYCDLDLDSSGTHYVVTVDVVSGNADSYLYREQTEGVWTRVEVTALAGECGQVSTDSLSNSPAVLADDQIVEFYADTLGAKGTIDLSGLSGNLVDFASAQTHMIIVSKQSNATDSLLSVDRSGAITDSVSLDSGRAVFVQVAGSPDYRAWWTGRDTDPAQYRIGYWTIEAAAVN